MALLDLRQALDHPVECVVPGGFVELPVLALDQGNGQSSLVLEEGEMSPRVVEMLRRPA